MKTKQQAKTLATKAKWILYSGVALNTLLLFAAFAETAKSPQYAGE